MIPVDSTARPGHAHILNRADPATQDSPPAAIPARLAGLLPFKAEFDRRRTSPLLRPALRHGDPQ